MQRQRSQHKRRGTALVEMALTLPIFMMVLLGIVEFGRAMMVGQLVTNASREGARLAVIGGNSNADVISYVNSFLTGAINVSAGSITVTLTITPAPGNTTTGNEIANAQLRDLITVNVSVPFDTVSYVPGNYLNGKMLAGSTTMRHE